MIILEDVNKTIEEIRELDPDLDDLSWREICYIVALGMGDLNWLSIHDHSEGFEFSDVVYSKNKICEWPAYHESGEHAIRILKRLPEVYFFQSNGWVGRFVDHNPYGPNDKYEWITKVNPGNIEDGPNKLEKSITLAAARCILEKADLKQIVQAS